MTSEVEVFVKDSLRINALKEILDGQMSLSLKLENDRERDYSTEVHEDGKRVKVFGRFNISEDPTGEVLTIRPVMIDGSLVIIPHIAGNLAAKKVSVVRSANKQTEREFEINSDLTSLELIPQGKQCYTLKISYNGASGALNEITASGDRSRNVHQTPVVSNQQLPRETRQEETTDGRFESFSFRRMNPERAGDRRFESFEPTTPTVISNTARHDEADQQQELQRIETPVHVVSEPVISNSADADLQRAEKEIVVVEARHDELAQKRRNALDHLERIEAEYKKDYSAMEKELADVKSRMEADKSIIEYYQEKDITPIESIFQEINLKLEEAEAQIKLFIEAKQKKTSEIEGEIKANRRD